MVFKIGNLSVFFFLVSARGDFEGGSPLGKDW